MSSLPTPTPLRLLTRLAPSGIPVLRSAIRAGLGHVFGPPPFDPAAAPGDPGLFGPGSASWRVVAEPAAIIGGIRALLIQLLHPLAVAGVADHSTFRDDPMGRLHRTSAYVTVTTFGSTPEALSVARRVRGAHRPVSGATPDGRPYRAGDPDLLAVVSVALTASFLVTDRFYAPHPVGTDIADAFVAEQSRAAALLDPRVDLDLLAADESARRMFRDGTLALPMIDQGALPTNVAELDEAVHRIRREHAVTNQTRDLLGFLLWPNLSSMLRAVYWPMLAGALATLERQDLRLIGTPHLPVSGYVARTQTRTALAALRVASGLSPSQQAAIDRVS